ncbi:hypothetical protein [Phytoactinopolyspora endophytica]|uniref:hypothetical protein n=1 Tax=Phytoactinopolyspora endophytica TaxID=1642495 RepID=UPI00101B86D6|nr:hypothetical protein [Phytoactinopolyspora endophytica]
MPDHNHDAVSRPDLVNKPEPAAPFSGGLVVVDSDSTAGVCIDGVCAVPVRAEVKVSDGE